LERTNVGSSKKSAPVEVAAKLTNLGESKRTNDVLRLIPESESRLIREDLEPIALPREYILHEAGEKIEFTHFLTEGLVSLVVQTSDGRSVEVAVIGREGAIGAPLAFGLHRRPYRAIMQIPGSAMRIPSDLLEEKLRKLPVLRRALNRYVLVRGLQIAQIAACNRLHEIDQRLARWLLMCHDRVNSEVLPVTHELLAQMLGTGRPSVSLAAGVLQRTGLIETSRGAVRILDRRGLESAACECYHAIEQFNRTLKMQPEPND
jgi:CRP-like cAMP-binding protein